MFSGKNATKVEKDKRPSIAARRTSNGHTFNYDDKTCCQEVKFKVCKTQ